MAGPACRDAASFTQAFNAVFQAAGIRVIRSAVQAPRKNPVTERWIGSCRRELLDRTLIWNQRLWVPTTLSLPLTCSLSAERGRSS